MNRAWIPAGALAGVSVAGLIALGQLTDSLGAPVTFDSSVALPPVNVQHTSKPVSVKIDRGAVGSTSTSAALNIERGGAAAATNAPVSGESGSVGYRIPHTSSSSSSSSTHSSGSTTTTKSQKPPKRQTLLGGSSGPNSDTGLAGDGTTATPSVGGLRGSPGSDGP